MKFSAQQVGNSLELKGRHTNFIIHFLLIFLPFIIYAFHQTLYYEHIVYYSILLLHYKTSWFSLLIDNNVIIISKKALGVTYFKKVFFYHTLDFTFAEFILKNDTKELKLHYEFWDLDEFGVEIDAKYYVIGNNENAYPIFKSLKEWIEQD